MLSVVESVRFDTCLRNYTAACTRHIVVSAVGAVANLT